VLSTPLDRKVRGETMRYNTAWAVYNYNRIFCIELTRKAAIQKAERNCGKPWKDMKEYMSVVKLTLTPNA